MIFFTSSIRKANQFKIIYPEEKFKVCLDVDLIENQSLVSYYEMLNYKFSTVKRNINYDINVCNMIEDTIIEIPNDIDLFGRNIGCHIKDNGLNEVIAELSNKGKVKLISFIYFNVYERTYMFREELEGFFIYDEKEHQGICLEDFFYNEINNEKKLITINDYPRMKNFKKLRALIEFRNNEVFMN